MRLFNFQTEKTEDIPDLEVEGRLRDGGYGFVGGEPVSMEDIDGNTSVMDAQAASEAMSNGTHYFIGDEEFKAREDQDKYGTSDQELKTMGEAVLRSLSFRLSDVGLVKSGLVEKEDLLGRKRVNKDIAETTELMTTMGTLMAPTKLGGGLIRKFTPLGIMDKAAHVSGTALSKSINKVISKKLVGETVKTGAKIGAAAANVATQSIIDSTSMMTGNYVSDVALGNREFTAEDYGSRLATTVLTSGSVGALLGGTGRAGFEAGKAGFKAINKTNNETFKRLLKFADATETISAEKYKLDPNLTELKLDYYKKISNRPMVKVSIDGEDISNLVYRDGKKVVYFDLFDLKMEQQGRLAAGESAEILIDINNPSHVDNIGKFLRVDELGKFISDKTLKSKGFRAALEDAVLMTIEKPSSSTLAHMAISKNPVLREAPGIFKRRDRLLAVAKEAGEIPSNLINERNIIQKKIEKILNAIKANKKGNKYFSETFLTRKQINKKLNDFESKILGYKNGESVYITNMESLKRAGRQAFVTNARVTKNSRVPKYVMNMVRWAGGKTKQFNDFTADQLVKMGKKIKVWAREVDGKKTFLPSMETLSENVNRNFSTAENIISDSVTAAENIILRNNTDTGLTASSFGKYIRDTWLDKFKLPDGTIKPTFSATYNKIENLAQEFEHRAKVSSSGLSTSEPNLSISDLREIRINIDHEIKSWADGAMKANPLHDKIKKDIRTVMEDRIIKSIIDLPGGNDIAARYQKGKDLYSVTSNVFELIKKEFSRNASNNRIPITAIGMGIGGAQIGSSMGPVGSMVGGLAAAGARTAYKDYGDYFSSLVAEKIAKSNIDFYKKIDKAVNVFINKPIKSTTRAAGVTILQAKVKEDMRQQYLDDRNQLENLSEGMEVFIDQNDEKNGVINELSPELNQEIFTKSITLTQYLNEKFPLNPYPDYGYKEWTPADDQILSYNRFKQAVLHPKTIISNFENGYLGSEEIEVLKVLYPSILNKIHEAFVIKYKNQPLDYSKRVMLKRLFGINIDKTTDNRNMMLLQGALKQKRQERESKIKGSSGEFSGQQQLETERIRNK